MFKAIFKILFKLVLAAGAVFAVFSLLQYFNNQQSDYIEIYNDNDDMDGEFF